MKLEGLKIDFFFNSLTVTDMGPHWLKYLSDKDRLRSCRSPPCSFTSYVQVYTGFISTTQDVLDMVPFLVLSCYTCMHVV